MNREMRAHRNGRFLKSLAADDERSAKGEVEKIQRNEGWPLSPISFKRKNDLKDTKVFESTFK